MAKIKQGLKNLSLRKSIILYIIIFAAVAILFSVFITYMCRNAKEQIYTKYPQAGERYYLTNEAGERLGDGVFVGNEYISYSAQDNRMLQVINFIENATIPLLFSLCMIIAVFAFYQNKLKKPLDILDVASQRISDNDLDFAIDYTSKDEMGKLCASFEKMRFSLWSNNRLMWRQIEQRKHLNAAFAHDLRTPLTVLKGYAEILQFNDDMQATKETAITMSKHIARLEQYVDTMSSLQRIEDVVPDLQKVDLKNVLPQVKQMAELICEKVEKICVFQSELTEQIAYLDIEMFSQVIENIITNAVRYANRNITIALIEQDNIISVAVLDDGAGFSAESLEKAGEPYYTEETDKTRHFGLGLYICKVLCRNHGGDIKIDNVDGGGLVTVTFKIAAQ